MNILGIGGLYHSSSAAVLCDGQLLAAAEEERFNRKKYYGGLPIGAIDFCLRKAGLQMSDVDVIAYADMPFGFGPHSQLATVSQTFLQRIRAEGGKIRMQVVKKNCSTSTRALGCHPSTGIRTNGRGAGCASCGGVTAPCLRFVITNTTSATRQWLTSLPVIPRPRS